MHIPFLVFKIGEENNWVCKKIFLKNLHLKFFFQKFSIQKKNFSIFPNLFKKNDYFCQIWIQYDLSFHLMYILDVFEERIRFSKIFIPNLGKFSLWKYAILAWPYGKTRQARVLIIDSTDHWRPKFSFEAMYSGFESKIAIKNIKN